MNTKFIAGVVMVVVGILMLLSGQAEAGEYDKTLQCNVMERPRSAVCELSMLDRHVLNQFTSRIHGVRTVAFACLKELSEYGKPDKHCATYTQALQIINFYLYRINKIDAEIKNKVIARNEHVYVAFLAHDKVENTGLSIVARILGQQAASELPGSTGR